MSSAIKSLFLFMLAASLICFAGCRKDPDAAQPPAAVTNAKPVPPPAPLRETSDPAAEDQSEAKLIEASFANLSPEDRALATKQKICPVGKGPLGAMGAPIKVTVAGHDVFICCEHCQEPLLADPAKHLANIGLKPTAETPAQ